MKKSIIAAATLVLLSASSFAAGNFPNTATSSEGANGNPLPEFGRSNAYIDPVKKSWSSVESNSTDALEIGDEGRMDPMPNYINRSQLR